MNTFTDTDRLEHLYAAIAFMVHNGKINPLALSLRLPQLDGTELDITLNEVMNQARQVIDTIPQKKYLLFAGANYQEQGGMGDFKGEFGTVAQALEFAKSYANDIFYCGLDSGWLQIVDRNSMQVAVTRPSASPEQSADPFLVEGDLLCGSKVIFEPKG